jgi:hypothetical protein
MLSSSSHGGALVGASPKKSSTPTHTFFALMLEPFPLAARRFRSLLVALSGAGACACTNILVSEDAQRQGRRRESMGGVHLPAPSLQDPRRKRELRPRAGTCRSAASR